MRVNLPLRLKRPNPRGCRVNSQPFHSFEVGIQWITAVEDGAVLGLKTFPPRRSMWVADNTVCDCACMLGLGAFEAVGISAYSAQITIYYFLLHHYLDRWELPWNGPTEKRINEFFFPLCSKVSKVVVFRRDSLMNKTTALNFLERVDLTCTRDRLRSQNLTESSKKKKTIKSSSRKFRSSIYRRSRTRIRNFADSGVQRQTTLWLVQGSVR